MATILTDSLVGQLVDGRYKVDSRIARGGMATVYLATDRRLDREVALKVMHPHLADGATGGDFVSRFRREARAAARLTHPGLVAVFDQGVDGETSYLTMEYVDGTNLRRRLHQDGPLPVGDGLKIVDDVLDALAAAHRQHLVHRDIKPENVLLATDGRVKVADFGLARAVTEVTSTTTGTILGTVAYLGPELIATGACDTRTDIYAVGIMLYEMLTGRQPFVGETPIQVAFQHVNNDIPLPSQLVPWLPPELDELVCAMASRDPQDRPADAPAALELLRRARASLPDDITARRADPPPPVVSLAEGTPSDDDEEDGDTALLTDTGTGTDDEAPDDAGEEDAALASRPDPSAATGTGGDSSDGHADEDVEAHPSSPEPLHPTESLVHGSSGSTIALPLGTARAFNQTVTVAPPSATAADGKPVHHRRRAVVWTLVVLLVLGGLGGTGAWWFLAGPGAYTTVPGGLTGVSVEDASAVLAAVELDVTTAEAYSDSVPAGTVLSADPGDGERILRDGSVELTVSKGIEHFTVPAGLTGVDVSETTAALETAGFTAVSQKLVWDTGVAAEVVMEVSVDEGAVLPHNTPITLTVSKGPEPVTVPQVQLLDLEDATEQLSPWDLTPVTTEEYSDTVAEGKVISQSPEQGSEAFRGDTVNLVISLGKPFVTVPDVIAKPHAEAEEILRAAGFEVEVTYWLGVFGNEVRQQSEAPGTELRKGSTIELFL